MKTIFDSSVLIAAFVEAHPKHDAAKLLLERYKKKGEYLVSAHSLAEIYSVLTRAPFTPPITPSIAKKLIAENIEREAKIISLTGKEYLRVVNELVQLGLGGGIIYDAIIVACAKKAQATHIVTTNPKDFSKLVPDGSIRIISP